MTLGSCKSLRSSIDSLIHSWWQLFGLIPKQFGQECRINRVQVMPSRYSDQTVGENVVISRFSFLRQTKFTARKVSGCNIECVESDSVELIGNSIVSLHAKDS